MCGMGWRVQALAPGQVWRLRRAAAGAEPASAASSRVRPAVVRSREGTGAEDLSGISSCSRHFGCSCNREGQSELWRTRLHFNSLSTQTGSSSWLVLWQRSVPRSVPGKNTLSRIHPGSWLLNIIQRPRFTLCWIIDKDGKVASPSLKRLKHTDTGRQETWGYHANVKPENLAKYIISDHSIKNKGLLKIQVWRSGTSTIQV